MKKQFLSALLLTLLAGKTLMAITPEELAKQQPRRMSRYIQRGNSDSLMELAMEFNGARLKGLPDLAGLRGRSIKRITLYYTVYKLSETFSQPALNLQRFRNLQAMLPEVFRSSLIEWRMIGQTACKTVEEGRTFFHGFVLEFRPLPSPASVEAEVSSISRMVLNDSLGKDTVYYTEKVAYRKRRKWTGKFLPRSARKRAAHIVYRERSIWKRNKQYVTVVDTVVYRNAVRKFVPSEYAVKFIHRNLTDTTVMAALNRNRQWKDMVLVVDATGSMGPYTGQLFVWYKLNSLKRKVESFTFFNDGNNASDRKKKIGCTGGIYYSELNEPELVIKTGTDCMRRGCGGDAPENNCEAILATIRKHPACKEVVMIADNWANMRDISLAGQINRPVHIILCGVNNNYFNTEYLDLARLTGGSVHTIDKDIENLVKLSEGSRISFGDKIYIIRGGKFELLREM